MKSCLVNYNYDPEWIQDYPELEVILYDRSDDGMNRNLEKYGTLIRTENKGDVDADKLSFLIENYNRLPEVFLWGKSNLFKFVDTKDFEKALFKRDFSPLLKYTHKTYSDKCGQVCFYKDGMYYERADSWFFNATEAKNFKTWNEWCIRFGLPLVSARS